MISAKKSKHLIVVVVAALLPQWTNNATAYSANFGFSYSGAISAISPRYDPFGGGWTVNPPTPVYGHVLYDSTRPATDPIAGCDCMGYRQHIPGGFTAIVGHTIFRADDYVIQIKNDLAPPGGASQDTVSILWSSAFSPSLDSPLWVNGVPYTNALFQLNLDSANDTFSDSSLPPSLDLGRFASTVNFLDDNRSDSKFGAFFQWSALKPWAGPGDYNDSDSIDSDD